MAAAASASAGPRYAPGDPTLPKPWRGLVDGKTGYFYFWNPETNVTQYEKPAAPAPAVAPPVPISSSPHIQQQSSQFHDEDGDRYRSGGNGGFRYEAESATQQVANGGTFQSQYAPDVTTSSGQGGYAKGNGAVDVGSADAYRRQHEITIIGDNVPLPFLSFQSTGFPSEILWEV